MRGEATANTAAADIAVVIRSDVLRPDLSRRSPVANGLSATPTAGDEGVLARTMLIKTALS
jgi:hypothetical protein